MQRPLPMTYNGLVGLVGQVSHPEHELTRAAGLGAGEVALYYSRQRAAFGCRHWPDAGSSQRLTEGRPSTKARSAAGPGETYP
jgi:hypothetical protein